jgi:hypothetical protein
MSKSSKRALIVIQMHHYRRYYRIPRMYVRVIVCSEGISGGWCMRGGREVDPENVTVLDLHKQVLERLQQTW